MLNQPDRCDTAVTIIMKSKRVASDQPIIFILLIILLHHYRFKVAQSQPEGLIVEDRCAMEGQLPVNPGGNYSDNLSCPVNLNDRMNGRPLQCFNRSELCNGVAFCDSGIDEGLMPEDFYFRGNLNCKWNFDFAKFDKRNKFNQQFINLIESPCTVTALASVSIV